MTGAVVCASRVSAARVGESSALATAAVRSPVALERGGHAAFGIAAASAGAFAASARIDKQ
jgi:hypothetical protein